MDVHDLARAIDAAELTPPALGHRAVGDVYASNTMSDLIAHAEAQTVLATALNNIQLVRVAELMDVPALCLVGDATPGSDLIARAEAAGAAILVSRRGLDETVSAIRACITAAGEAARR